MRNTDYKKRRAAADMALRAAAEKLVRPHGSMPTLDQLLLAADVSSYMFRNAFGSVTQLVHTVVKDRFAEQLDAAGGDVTILIGRLANLSWQYQNYCAGMSKQQIAELAYLFTDRSTEMDEGIVDEAMLLAICVISGQWPANPHAAKYALHRLFARITA